MPSVPSKPLIGALGAVINPPKGQIAILTSQFAKELGGLYLLPMPAGASFVVCTDANLSEQVLTTDAKLYHRGTKLLMQAMAAATTRHNMFLLEGKEHALHKRIAYPAFGSSYLRKLIPVFEKHSNRMIERINSLLTKGNTISMDEVVTRCTLDIICDAGLGFDLDSQLVEGKCEMAEKIEIWLAYIDASFRVPLIDYIPTPSYIKARKIAKEMRAWGLELVAKRKEELKSSSEKKTDILSAFINAIDPETKEPLSDEALMSEVLLFLIAGHETSAAALSWSLYLLSQHPFYFSKLKKEAEEAKKGHSEWSMESVRDLKLTDAVVLETMRLYSPVSGVARTVAAEEGAELGGYHLPKGTDVIINSPGIHYDPKHFSPHPNKFQPERFLSTPASERHPYSFLPFGAGPRACIGRHFAMLELKIMLSSLTSNFTFEYSNLDLPASLRNNPQNILLANSFPEDGPDAVQNLTIRPKGGLNMLVKKTRPQQ